MTTKYQDYSGPVFDTLAELAQYRINNRAPLLGDAVCPAAEYTFALSDDDGRSWRNPNENDQEDLRGSVIAATGCCRLMGPECPVLRETPE